MTQKNLLPRKKSSTNNVIVLNVTDRSGDDQELSATVLQIDN
jgi:hypothetical protein